MPTPTGVKLASASCGVAAGCGSMGASKEGWWKKWGRSREAPSVESGREEACDERSTPQDVTSSWTRREGINLQQEVEPHLTGRSPRNSPPKDTAEAKSAAEMNIQ